MQSGLFTAHLLRPGLGAARRRAVPLRRAATGHLEARCAGHRWLKEDSALDRPPEGPGLRAPRSLGSRIARWPLVSAIDDRGARRRKQKQNPEAGGTGQWQCRGCADARPMSSVRSANLVAVPGSETVTADEACPPGPPVEWQCPGARRCLTHACPPGRPDRAAVSRGLPSSVIVCPRAHEASRRAHRSRSGQTLCVHMSDASPVTIAR